MRLRVLIVDDHHAFADSLAIAVDAQDDLECLGTAGTVDEAISIAKDNEPDVVPMDVELPEVDGLVGTARLKQLCPEARVLILTGHDEPSVMARAADAGASGFLPKHLHVPEVIEAISSARSGGMIVDRATLSLLVNRAQPDRAGRRLRST